MIVRTVGDNFENLPEENRTVFVTMYNERYHSRYSFCGYFLNDGLWSLQDDRIAIIGVADQWIYVDEIFGG